MKALRWHGRRDLRLEDVELEGPLGPDEVQIQVAYCGICGSDLAEFRQGPVAIQPRVHKLTGQAPPITLGHEFSGTVVAIGSGVTTVAVGDRVSSDATLRCGVCLECRSGRYNLCASGASIGLAADGGMAEAVCVPEYVVVPLPDGVDLVQGALLEPSAVALHALERGHAEAGKTALVVGFGPVGAAAAALGSALGLRVLVSEPDPARRATAERLGHQTFAPTGQTRDDARTLRAETDGGPHLVLECSGTVGGLESSLELTRRGGDIVMVGIPKAPVTVDAARMILFERALVGALGYQHHLERVAQMIAAGLYDPRPLATSIVPLDDGVAQFTRMVDGPSGDLKVLLSPTAQSAGGGA